MRINVRLFAAAKDAVNAESINVELSEGDTIGDLRAAITKEYPALQSILDHSLFAVDNEYSSDVHRIEPSSTVACIPPVSGG